MAAPPAWAYVDFRNDESRNQAVDCSAATAPLTSPAADSSPAPYASAPSPSSSKPPSMTTPNDFKFLRELGSGSWSTVMEATQVMTGKRYALKILSKAQLIKLKKVKYATVEKDTLAKLSNGHPGIIRMHAAFQDETSLYFVLDLADNGDLADLVKKHGSLSLPCARWYTAQIVDAVLWMHSKGVVHRDLKPENVLLDSEFRVKLTDFGSAYNAPDGDLSPRASSFVGSAAYVSPELLNRESKTTSSSSDIWAIGCTLYFLVAGMPAFAAINDYQSFRKIEVLDYMFPDGFYDTAKDFVQRLLVLDPADRLGVEPKSSPSELRHHPLFSPQSPEENPSTSPISWDTLWTDPPPVIETGIAAPTQPHGPGDDEDVWESMVQEFSLVNLRSPGPLDVDGDPLSPNGLLMPSSTSTPVDVPPDAVPSVVVETVSPPPAPGVGSLAADPSEAPASEEAPAADPVFKDRDWSAVLEPGETLRRVAGVRTQLRKGLLKQSRPCALLLTSGPRVVCVVVDEKDGAAPVRAGDVKRSFVFARAGGELNGAGLKKTDKNTITGCRATDDGRRLVLETAEKEYTYDFTDQATLDRWAQDINAFVAPS
ncbi:Serine/threonine-protein kinase ksg1 [Trametes pubescens]|uniref:non-specific serine/threonine protein kinase n=1 Tax=Trametes pubescens TaxID=154538 RepID=A0A1M2VZW7_TRAPU|nr:Serine/threonine-protein kinase ksg1 [Trametes pubescens]